MQIKNTRSAANAAKTKGAKAANGAVVNAKSSIWRNRKGFRIDRRRKPEVVVVRLGGKIRIVGAIAAAKWLGVSRTTFANIVQKPNGGTGRNCPAAETVALVRSEYPELFRGAK